MAITRVVVADDSPTVRARIVDALSAAPDIEVIGEAGDGRGAIELCERHHPDVVTLDMMMPVMNGLEATEHIMAFSPTPIVIVSASTNRGELFRTYDALAAGALEVIEKPHGGEHLEAWDQRLVDTVRIAARVRVITHPRARLRPRVDRTDAPDAIGLAREESGRDAEQQIVAIGASTGGPASVLELLGALPRDYPYPVLLVLHVSAPFAAALAEWLGRESPVPVRGAVSGAPLAPGVTLAPAEQHMVLDGGRVRLTDAAPVHSCRPSVDVLFDSVARHAGARSVGVLLTGMGRDGADGLLRIRRAGGITIAQNEETSAVFGMPREAIAIGAAEHVLSPQAAGVFLREFAARGAARRSGR